MRTEESNKRMEGDRIEINVKENGQRAIVKE